MEVTVNLAVATLLVAALGTVVSAQPARVWPIHDEGRPQPPVVDPGALRTAERPAAPPSDAVVLFDGKDLAAWRSTKDGFNFLILGLGPFVGSLLWGRLGDVYRTVQGVDFSKLFLVPSAVGLLAALVLLVGFRPDRTAPAAAEAA